jgi:hypothetical protein
MWARVQVAELEAKAGGALAAAESAERVAGAAMAAAEGAVREEMEAAAVAKQTAAALNAVLAELQDLGVSFETSAKLERSLEAKGVSKARCRSAMPSYSPPHGERPALPLPAAPIPNPCTLASPLRRCCKSAALPAA